MNNRLPMLINKIEGSKTELIDRFHIKQLSLFGSYIRGTETPESDLDILVSFSILPSLFEFVDLQLFLTDLLGVKVDLVILDDLKPFLSHNILHEKINIL
jgi:predicted nucleotidyltransferase